MKSTLKFKKDKKLTQFTKHNKKCFKNLINQINAKKDLPATDEGVTFSKTNGGAVFTHYKEGDRKLKSVSITFFGKIGKTCVTFYDGYAVRSPGDGTVVTRNKYNLVNAPVTIIPQIKQSIQKFLN